MKDINKRRLTAAAIATWGTVVEDGLDALYKVADRITRNPRQNYWMVRGHQLDSEIKECPNCTADDVKTGYHAHKVKDEYCDLHQKEATKIIWRYARTIK